MEQFLQFINTPFAWGLLLGLLIAFFAWKSGLSTKLRLSRDVHRLESELRELQGHLNTQLKINSQGNKSLQDERDELRQQNENLRVSLAALQSKPGRAEHRQYQITESAVRTMRAAKPTAPRPKLRFVSSTCATLKTGKPWWSTGAGRP